MALSIGRHLDQIIIINPHTICANTCPYPGAKLTGRLLTNGLPRDQAEFADIAAYVTQEDDLLAQLVRAFLHETSRIPTYVYMCVMEVGGRRGIGLDT